MNHDVDDPNDGLQGHRAMQAFNLATRAQCPDSNLLSRIRHLNPFVFTSIGSLFSASSSNNPCESQEYVKDITEYPKHQYNYDIWDVDLELQTLNSPILDGPSEREPLSPALDHGRLNIKDIDTLTPTPTRPSTPYQQPRFADVKRIFNNFARARQINSYADLHKQELEMSATCKPTSPLHIDPLYCPISLPGSASSKTDFLRTPPLTPDTLNGHTFLSPSPSEFSQDSDHENLAIWNNGLRYDLATEDIENTHRRSLEIKEGKKPERPSRFLQVEALVEDNLEELDTTSEPIRAKDRPLRAANDKDEWYGLEYTIELSSRERRPSDTQPSSAGEHSKSRESWAAIHKGTIHPFFEDEDYYQWKNWHRYLDREDERRRHRKGIEFKTRSKDLAWFFADEMKTLDIWYWQMDKYGMISKDVEERLDAIAEHRPDPYHPPKAHNLGWYLKRSRSITSLRELRPYPN